MNRLMLLTVEERNRASGKGLGIGPFMGGLLEAVQFILDGITRDGSTGNPIASCTVALFKTADNSFVADTVSGADGYYRFTCGSPAQNFFVRVYLPGSPDKAGTSVNTLVATA